MSQELVQIEPGAASSQDLLALIRRPELQQKLSQRLLWGGVGATPYRFDDDIQRVERVEVSRQDMTDLAEYLFTLAPFEDLTDEVKNQILLVIRLSDRGKMGGTLEQLVEQQKLKRASLETLLTEHFDSTQVSKLLELYDAFVERNLDTHSKPEWVSDIAIAYAGIIDRLQSIAETLHESNHIDPEMVARGIDTIQRELNVLANSIPSGHQQAYVKRESDLTEQIHEIIAREVFPRSVEKSKNGAIASDFRLQKVVRGEELKHLRAGAEDLRRTQETLASTFIGEDIFFEFIDQRQGSMVLKPGDSTRVLAHIPLDYFKDINESTITDQAVAEMFIRRKFAAATWRGPIERSRAGQVNMNLEIPRFDIRKVEITNNGEVIVEMEVWNSSPSLTQVYASKEIQPALRLALEPTEKMFVGQDLIQKVKTIIRCGDEEIEQYLFRSGNGIPVAMRLPVERYMVQDIGSVGAQHEIDMTALLQAQTFSREQIDRALCFKEWTTNPSGVIVPADARSSVHKPFTIIGETRPVAFPSDVVGIIAPLIMCEANGSQRWVGRHGGSRAIDRGFGDNLKGYTPMGGESGVPVRTEILVNADSLDQLGQQYIVVYLYP